MSIAKQATSEYFGAVASLQVNAVLDAIRWSPHKTAKELLADQGTLIDIHVCLYTDLHLSGIVDTD